MSSGYDSDEKVGENVRDGRIARNSRIKGMRDEDFCHLGDVYSGDCVTSESCRKSSKVQQGNVVRAKVGY